MKTAWMEYLGTIDNLETHHRQGRINGKELLDLKRKATKHYNATR